MATVWPVYEGKRPSNLSWGTLPLADAIATLAVRPEYFVGDDPANIRFGDATEDLTLFGYRHVLVEIGGDDAGGDWRPGYYKSPLSPEEAYFRLQVLRLLGPDWRAEWAHGVDADGEPLIRLRAILKADAPPDTWQRRTLSRIETDVRKAASQSDLQQWVSVRFLEAEDVDTVV